MRASGKTVGRSSRASIGKKPLKCTGYVNGENVRREKILKIRGDYTFGETAYLSSIKSTNTVLITRTGFEVIDYDTALYSHNGEQD
jgi:hypothetical protein